MANTNTPTGLSPVRYVSGAPYNGAYRIYSVAAGYGTAIYVGDPVVDIGTTQLSDIHGYTKDVQLAATTDVITGVVIGVVPETRDSLTYRAASTLRYLMVADDPNLLFEAQEATGGGVAADDLGLNISFNAGTPSTVTGRSGLTLKTDTEADTNTLALKLVEIVNRPDNAAGDSCKWLVRINRHRYVDQLAGV